MLDEACLYHATPLHYLPHILHAGALYAKSVLGVQGIRSRAGAARRDRMLGLADYVHLSTRPHTPLLADKMAKGYPHALLVFPREAVLALPGTALLPYNTKAWRARADFVPITDPAEKEILLHAHLNGRRSPSLEVLVKYALGMDLLRTVAFYEEEECASVQGLLEALHIPSVAPLTVCPTLFPRRDPYRPTTAAAIAEYFAACQSAGHLLPPPEIAFD